MADDKPIIVVKKKGGHGGHHGGAWKIAYADFVTAMMCFFMVMWLVNTSSSATRVSIASYFRKPGIFNEGSGTPLMMGGAGILADAFVPPRPEDKRKLTNPTDDPAQKPRGESERDLDKHYMQEGRQEPQRDKGPDSITGLNADKKEAKEIKREIKLKQIAERAKGQISKMLQANPEMAKLLGQLDMKVEADGLKIDIMDTERVSMFDSGSARIKKEAEGAFLRVTQLIRQYPNNLEISGHTDSKPFPSRAGSYTNWELSADRANAARRLIETQGFPSGQVTSVVGKAATDPKMPENTEAPQNRRITLKLKFDIDQMEVTPTPDPGIKALESMLGIPTPVPPTIDPGALAPDGTPLPTPTPTPTETPTPSPTPPPKEKKRIVARSPSDRIKLPDGTPLAENPEYMPEDKIFGDAPVIGPRELFSGR